VPQPTDTPLGKSRVVARSIKIGGRNTGLALERAFWDALKYIAAAQGTSVSRLLETVDNERRDANRSSAVRLFVLDYYRNSGRCWCDSHRRRAARRRAASN
jgi:predicted DNA-binding ribbon-helix-helix protein